MLKAMHLLRTKEKLGEEGENRDIWRDAESVGEMEE